jgi:transposase-like protein
MSDTISIVCPKCGHDDLKTGAEPKPGSLNGFSCNSCGYAVTEGDIRAQALKVAEDLIRRRLKL